MTFEVKYKKIKKIHLYMFYLRKIVAILFGSQCVKKNGCVDTYIAQLIYYKEDCMTQITDVCRFSQFLTSFLPSRNVRNIWKAKWIYNLYTYSCNGINWSVMTCYCIQCLTIVSS